MERESNGLARASHEGSTTDLLTERLLELSQPDLQTVLRCLQPNRPGGNIKVSHLRPSGLVESRGFLQQVGLTATLMRLGLRRLCKLLVLGEEAPYMQCCVLCAVSDVRCVDECEQDHAILLVSTLYRMW